MQKIPLTKIDLFLFNRINRYAKKSRVLDFFGIFCAAYLGYVLLVWLFTVAYTNNNWQMLMVPTVAGLVSLALNETIYIFYKRKRPLEVIIENTLIPKPPSPAFPSSHTSFFFALSFTLFLFNFQLAVMFIILSSLISLARIFCGVHWPSDIVGGVASAFISFLLVLLVRSIL